MTRVDATSLQDYLNNNKGSRADETGEASGHTCCWPAAAAMLIQSGCMPALTGICAKPPLLPALAPAPLWKGWKLEPLLLSLGAPSRWLPLGVMLFMLSPLTPRWPWRRVLPWPLPGSVRRSVTVDMLPLRALSAGAPPLSARRGRTRRPPRLPSSLRSLPARTLLSDGAVLGAPAHVRRHLSH